MHDLIEIRGVRSPLCAVLTALLFVQPASAQDEPGSLYESRFVEARGIRLQYADLGGSGLPIILIQDIHDWSLAERSELTLLARFADSYRVLAPVRRGWGESDDTGWGYDVATQAEIRAFVENYWRGTCDLGETAVSRIGPRAGWRPRFLDDETFRIDIPALRFVWPSSASRSLDVRRLDHRVPRLAAAEPSCDGAAARKEYFAALAADQDRLTALRQALTESDRTLAMDSAMMRAFGSNLRTEVDPGGWDDIHDFVYPHIRRFLEEVALREAARQPAPALDSQRRE
jgi:pimeloyl-ACP methyl ester carboxylesterase